MGFLLGLFLWLGGLSAQETQRPEQIYFSALDRAEKPVLGLTAKDFSLRVNGWPVALEHFQAGKGAMDRSVPLVAWILLDANPNINSGMIASQAAAAAGFFGLLHPDSAVGVQLVSDRMETLAPLAHDPDALRQAFTDYSRKRTELKVRMPEEPVWLGPGGILKAIELCMQDMGLFVATQESLQHRSVQRAILIVSDGNVNPSYYKRGLFEEAALKQVFLYPIFVPRVIYGPWLDQYFSLGKNSAGLASTFGALNPGSNTLRPSRDNKDPNALTFNLLNIVRDLNGKYSFAAPQVPEGGRLKLDLRCLQKDVQIRLSRKTIESLSH